MKKCLLLDVLWFFLHLLQRFDLSGKRPFSLSTVLKEGIEIEFSNIKAGGLTDMYIVTAVGDWCLNPLYTTHIVVQRIFNSFACGTCAPECVCMRVLGWSVGGAAQVVPPPSPGVKTLQTLGAHRGNSRAVQLLRRVTGGTCEDRRQQPLTAGDSRAMATGRKDPAADRHV